MSYPFALGDHHGFGKPARRAARKTYPLSQTPTPIEYVHVREPKAIGDADEVAA